jgi:hypothetical protein
MRIWLKNRCFAALVAVGYLLTVSMASLFHDHSVECGGGCCHGHSPAHSDAADEHHAVADQHSGHHETPCSPGRCPTDGRGCCVCQFLAQKPAPMAEVAPVDSGTLVQEAALPPPARLAAAVFSAWHSRGPPAVA